MDNLSTNETTEDYDENDVDLVHFPDGTQTALLAIDETYIPIDILLSKKRPNLITALTNVPTFPCREDDVFICAFMKAGTHWVWELCSMLVNRTTEYDANPKESCMLEFHLPEQMESFRSPRILNSHLLPRQMPTKILTQRNKVIFLQRNPKDVAVSTYHHVTKLHDYKCSFSAFLKVFLNKVTMFHNWFEYTTAWEKALTSNYKDVPVLNMLYEDLKRDGVNGIRRIAEFLEVDCDEDCIRLVHRRCGFDLMKDAKLERAKIKNDATQTVMYRKGQIGDWKNWFTVADNEDFDIVFRARMKDSNFSYTWE